VVGADVVCTEAVVLLGVAAVNKDVRGMFATEKM
jgi:hypothetical protein